MTTGRRVARISRAGAVERASRAAAALAVLLCSGAWAATAYENLRAGPPGPLRDALVRLARQGVEATVRGTSPAPLPGNLPAALRLPSGAFVTLKRGGRVRSCMGTLVPQCPDLAREVRRSAALAATGDPCHAPVQQGELEDLQYTVTVAGPLRPVRSRQDLEPLRLGLLVVQGDRRALLLPGEARTAAWQEQECRRKAGIRSGPVQRWVFPAVSFGPGR